MFGQILLQIILILLNAFFAATEIAVVSLNEMKVKAKADDGDKKAKKMLKLIENPTKFLSTIQIGITLAGFLGSAFAADNFAELLTVGLVNAFSIPEGSPWIATIDTVSVVIITLILSFFTLVFGELVPKRIAMKHKEKVANAFCGIVNFLSIVLRPVIWLLTITTNGILRLFGINPNEEDDPVSKEDIMIMLDAGVEEETMDESDVEYIKNVFKLDTLTVADVMTHRKQVVFIERTEKESVILDIIENEGYSRIPVCGESIDEIVGILYTKDYLLKHSKPDFKIEDAMFEATYVPETMPLDVLFKDMQASHNHIVIVVNEYGIPSGVVTMEDILEELVGEIWDESDEETKFIDVVSDGVYKIDAGISVEEFFDFFELEPDDEIESNTLNGWIIEKNEDIPDVGYSFNYQNLIITVTKSNEIMAHEVEVKVIKEDEQKTEE